MSTETHIVQVAGPRTNIEFLRVLASNPHFVAGEVETGFIKVRATAIPDKGAPPEAHVQAAVALALRDTARTSGPVTGDLYSPWASESHWSARINDAAGRVIVFDEGNDRPVRVRLTRSPDANACSLGFATFDCEVEGASGAALTAGDDVIPSEGGASVTFKNVRAVLSGAEGVDVVADIGNRQIKSRVVVDQDVIHVFGEVRARRPRFLPRLAFIPNAPSTEDAFLSSSTAQAGPATFTLPPPARGIRENADAVQDRSGSPFSLPEAPGNVLVKPGQFVEKGAPLHVIKAPAAGVVARVMYNAGDLVEENKSLVAFAEDENR
ncbi:MAG: hypothetical protein BJ554DRAFT_3163 [Olpidium bornovanus]|uniref:Lipoyl-binding domain-containing protein n=1 Tax=Olpidium bornovanus TaxID=278681 RepID=A0A8H8DFU8_9FUNG|nr:MAG: hypothetical protein BJ554DRAFT_3163 [Olpidium bornovanus]